MRAMVSEKSSTRNNYHLKILSISAKINLIILDLELIHNIQTSKNGNRKNYNLVMHTYTGFGCGVKMTWGRGGAQSVVPRKGVAWRMSASSASSGLTGQLGDHGANLTRHVQKIHPTTWEQTQQSKNVNLKRKIENSEAHIPFKIRKITDMLKPPKISVSLNKDILWDACIELCTVNGRPFKLLEDSGFRKIIDPILSSLGNQMTINSQNIVDGILEKAKVMQSIIKSEIKKKMICLKLDGVTNGNRSFLGINMQYIKDGKLKIRTLAIKEIHVKHTAENLKEMILEVLDRFDIPINQIYSCTTDNGRNMVKAISILNEENASLDEDIDKWTDSNIEYEDEEGENSRCTLDKNLQNIVDESSFIEHSAIGIRCAAHTLQLSIKDAVNFSNCTNIISKAKSLAKKLRAQNVAALLKSQKISRPTIDCPTRWGSTYNMLKSLLDPQLKNFCSCLSKENKEYYLNEQSWTKIEEIVSALKPADIATIKLQSDNLTVGDFYGVWMKCKLDVEKLNSSLAKSLYSEMSKRENDLFTNEGFISAMYMDLRYQIILSDNQREKAVAALTKLYCKMSELKSSSLVKIVQSPMETELESANAADDLEMILSNLEKEKTAQQSNSLNTLQEIIKPILISFGKERRLDRNKDILQYWEEESLKKPYLYEISKVVLAQPSTQVSVERLFSGLKFLIGHLRGSLRSDVLDAICMIRSNCIFMK